MHAYRDASCESNMSILTGYMTGFEELFYRLVQRNFVSRHAFGKR